MKYSDKSGARFLPIELTNVDTGETQVFNTTVEVSDYLGVDRNIIRHFLRTGMRYEHHSGFMYKLERGLNQAFETKLGCWIAHNRIKRNMSRADLGKLFEVGYGTVKGWEEDGNPKPHELFYLEHLFGEKFVEESEYFKQESLDIDV